MTFLNLTADDIVNLLKFGKSAPFLPLGKTVGEVKRFLGNPISEEGNSECGYLQYSSIRLGYTNEMIDEFAIIFEGKISFNISPQLIDTEEFSLNRNTQINELIYFLNYNNIKWVSYRESDLDYFFLKTASDVFIIFNLETGSLERITLSILVD